MHHRHAVACGEMYSEPFTKGEWCQIGGALLFVVVCGYIGIAACIQALNNCPCIWQ